ncbi:MAG: hypothetical protein AB7G37_10795 [Solirubrobacteraceae bacterium]
MTNRPAPTRHPHPTRWPIAPLLATTAALCIAAAALTLAPSGRGSSQPGEPGGLPGRLDPGQVGLAHAQATADRFAVTFAAYLSDQAEPSELRAAGASPALLRRIADSPARHAHPTPGSRRSHRTASAAAQPGYRSRGVTVTADGAGGWLATTSLTRTADQRDEPVPGLPLTFRLEPAPTAGCGPARVVVVDVNTGGHG